MNALQSKLGVGVVIVSGLGMCGSGGGVTAVRWQDLQTYESVVVWTQTGVASWYGPGFHGRLGANGQVYNQHAMTAAHRTLALGTRVRVTNTHTDVSVGVVITDRGPYVGGRVIDMSWEAGRRLGMVEVGTVEVKVEVIVR